VKWQDRAVQLREDHSWTETYRQIRKEYPEMELTDGQIRDAVRWRTRDKTKPRDPIDIHEAVKKALVKGSTSKEIAETTGKTERLILAAIEDLREQGIQIVEQNGKYQICKDIIPQENHFEIDWKGDRIIRFGLMGDPQFNSKYCQITHLHDYYDICQKEGIKTVYNTGDIDEGEEMRVGHKYECYNQGADDHIEEIVKNYPKREGIVTEFITGNHDHSLIKRAGLDIGRAIEKERPDMKYLGMSAAVINLTPNCTLELRHPTDGTAYALSYKTQKMIDAMQGGDKPNILAIGHYHKAEYLFYRNVHTYQTGCFQAQTNWMKGKQIAAMVGGWIVEIHVDDDGTITRCKGEFIPYYRMIKDDWKDWR
jgi:biotin operon repressor